MEKKQKIASGLFIITVVVGSLVIYANQDFPEPTGDLTDFPDFFTKNENYFITRIGGVPYIDRNSYSLEIKGLVDNPTSLDAVAYSFPPGCGLYPVWAWS